MICPECQSGTRVHKVEGPIRLRICLGCNKRFKTEETLLYEIGTMTAERLLRVLNERTKWQTYEGLAKHFCVTVGAVQHALRKLKGEGVVVFKLENRRKVWQLANKATKPKTTNPVAVPVNGGIVTHRIAEPGEEDPAAKRKKQKPSGKASQQTWFSVIG